MKKRAVSSSSEYPNPQMRAAGWRTLFLLIGVTGVWMALPLHGADATDKQTYEERLKKEREAAERREQANGTTDAATRRKEMNRRENEDKQRGLAEYKEQMLNNLAAVKDAYAKAEDAWKQSLEFSKVTPEQWAAMAPEEKTDALKQDQYRTAAAYYKSISMATVLGAEQMVETARARLLAMEDIGKKRLTEADDADLKQDYVREVDVLAAIIRDFEQTKSKDAAARRLLTLKSRPDVSAHVDLAQAQVLDAQGKWTEALGLYTAIANNPRYENSVAALKAKRRMNELQNNEESRGKIKAELSAKADKEAPLLLNAARNYMANNRPKLALEKLQSIVEKFPDSKYAEDARQQIKELEGLK